MGQEPGCEGVQKILWAGVSVRKGNGLAGDGRYLAKLAWHETPPRDAVLCISVWAQPISTDRNEKGWYHVHYFGANVTLALGQEEDT